MLKLNDSLVDDDADIKRPKRVEEPPKSCSIPVPGSFKKQIGLFYNGELSYKTVASVVAFVVGLIVLISYGGVELMHVGTVDGNNGYAQIFSPEALSQLSLTEAQDTPLPLTIEIG